MKKITRIVLFVFLLVLIVGCESKQQTDLKITYKNNDITPGEVLNPGSIKKEYELSEVPDCALGSKGLVYTFDDIEISTDENNKIYSVYFISPNIKTPEGISLGDKVSKVLKAFNDQSQDKNELTYMNSKVLVSFVLQNKTVTSIEYKLIVG